MSNLYDELPRQFRLPQLVSGVGVLEGAGVPPSDPSAEPFQARPLLRARNIYRYNTVDGKHRYAAVDVNASIPDQAEIQPQFSAFLTQSDKNVSFTHLQHGVELFLSDVQAILAHPLAEHINSRRLSFGSPDEVFYPMTEDQVADHAAQDTLILQSLELSGGVIRMIAVAVERAEGRPCTVSCYISTPESKAFDWHVDAGDSLVIQLVGEKVFHFRDREQRLRAGDVLMFKEQTEHYCTTVSPSIHLNFALQRR